MLDERGVRRLTQVLAAVITGLLLLTVVALALDYGPGDGRGVELELLNMGREGSLATWLAGSLLTALAVVSLLCGHADDREGGRWRRHWYLLAAAFLYVSIDELLEIHERLSDGLQAVFDTGGALYYAWVVPALVVVAVFGLVQLRFLLRLPRWTRTRMLLAAAVFVGAAVGLEMVESVVYTSAGADDLTLTFEVLTMLEEAAELAAVVLALTTLLSHLVRQRTELTVGGPGHDLRAYDRLDGRRDGVRLRQSVSGRSTR